MPFIVDGTAGGFFPSWTTATRPASPAVGQMGYNTTTGLFDNYTAAGWTSVLTNASQSIPFAALPTGSVLQVVQASTSTSVSTSSATPIDTGLTATITPKFATSKILAIVMQNGVSKTSAASNNCAILTLLRGATSLGNFGIFVAYTASASELISGTSGFTSLDSPATTSATTYKTQFSSAFGGSAINVQNNSAVSSITLMEIAG